MHILRSEGRRGLIVSAPLDSVQKVCPSFSCLPAVVLIALVWLCMHTCCNLLHQHTCTCTSALVEAVIVSSVAATPTICPQHRMRSTGVFNLPKAFVLMLFSAQRSSQLLSHGCISQYWYPRPNLMITPAAPSPRVLSCAECSFGGFCCGGNDLKGAGDHISSTGWSSCLHEAAMSAAYLLFGPDEVRSAGDLAHLPNPALADLLQWMALEDAAKRPMPSNVRAHFVNHTADFANQLLLLDAVGRLLTDERNCPDGGELAKALNAMGMPAVLVSRHCWCAARHYGICSARLVPQAWQAANKAATACIHAIEPWHQRTYMQPHEAAYTSQQHQFGP